MINCSFYFIYPTSTLQELLDHLASTWSRIISSIQLAINK